MRKGVMLVDHDPRWSRMFEAERRQILGAAGRFVEVVEHVGSTAIPELPAKPVIDILGGVSFMDRADASIDPLGRIGYEYVPEYEAIIPDRRYFRKGAVDPRTPHLDTRFHLHVVEVGGREWRKMILFRDYLRLHRAVALEYAELKRRLALEYEDDRDGYQSDKAPFIEGVLERAIAESEVGVSKEE